MFNARIRTFLLLLLSGFENLVLGHLREMYRIPNYSHGRKKFHDRQVNGLVKKKPFQKYRKGEINKYECDKEGQRKGNQRVRQRGQREKKRSWRNYKT